MGKLEKEVRFLKIYAVVMTLFFGVLAFSAFRQADQKTKFSEIDVERINIVEKDGKLKMVISNSERQHPGVIDGKTASRKRPAGALFFNEEGDECGGFGFSGSQKDGKTEAGALLAFDKFRQDQTVGIEYGESNGRSEIVNLNFVKRLDSYFNDRLAISLKRFNVTLISSVSRTPELRRWIEGDLTT
jgi:hypothetical protein